MLTERPMTQGKELVKTSNLIDRALIQVGAMTPDHSFSLTEEAT